MQTRIHPAEALLLDGHELVVAVAVAGKMLVELLQHRLAGGGRFEAHVLELQPIHRFKLHALEIVADVPSGLLEHFVENELHHQECWAGVVLVTVAHDRRIAPADMRVLFENGDFESARG